MTTPLIKIGTANNEIWIGFPEWEKSFQTTFWIVAKILNIIRTCFPCLTDGAAEIQLAQEIYYVYRSDLARILKCDAQASCSNVEELKSLALNYFHKNKARSEEHSLSSIERLVSESHQAIKEKIAVESRVNLERLKKELMVKEDEQIAKIRATVAHLPEDDNRRLTSERFIKNLKESRKLTIANLDEIATASGIALS
jgi:hypothetical protein